MRTRLVAAALGLALATTSVAHAQAVFRTGVDLVDFGVTVIDKRGSLVTDLKPSDFIVLEEGRRQRIEYFARGFESDDPLPPFHLGVLIDTSGSMIDDVQLCRSAAIKFLNTLTQAEDVTVVDFDTEVRVAKFKQADFARLVERVRSRKIDGWTALYDAMGVYLDGATADTGRKVLVVYSDGGDNRSSMNFSDLLTLVKASDVTVYAIGFLEHQPSSVRLEQRLRLQQLAETTGGQAFFPTSIKQLDEMYAKVVDEITARYTLGFQSDDLRTDGAWRDVEIRLARADLKGAKVRARKGYFAPYVAASKQ